MTLESSVSTTLPKRQSCLHIQGWLSGRASMTKHLALVADGHYTVNDLPERAFTQGLDRSMMRYHPYPETGELILVNFASDVNPEVNLGTFKVIMSLRDPRDNIVSRYFSAFTHPPPPHATPELLEFLREDKKRMEQLGLDGYIKDQEDFVATTYRDDIDLFLGVPPSQRLLLTYNLFVMRPESYTRKLAEFLEIDLDDNRVATLVSTFSLDNPSGVRYRHGLADPLPGRYARALTPDMARRVTDKFSDVLEFLSEYDEEEVRTLYSHQ